MNAHYAMKLGLCKQKSPAKAGLIFLTIQFLYSQFA